MKKKSSSNPLIDFIAKNYLSFGFLITAVASIGSFFFSEVLKLPPCDLCWYQRALMYSLAILFGIALWKNDKTVVQYVLPISVIGFLIAIYHNILQWSPTPLPCTTGSAVSCATKQIEIMGFDAIPVMSGLAFLTIILLCLVYRKYSK